MSSDYSYAEGITYAARAKSSKKIEKGLKRLLIIAVIIFTAELIWLFGISPFIPFSTVEVHGFEGFGRNEILHLAGIDESSSFMSTNIKEAQVILSGNILVESAYVVKRFPDKLSIFLTPRQAAAVVLTSSGARQVPALIDRQGVIFKIDESIAHKNLPVLSGMENPQLNMRLPASLVPLVESLSVISASSPELLAAISEIRIEPKAWDGFELVLYPVHSSIKVRLENSLSEDVLRYTLLMLNVFEASSPKPEEIDFRSGMGSYKIKEQST
ncbi:MAG: FtsQ-type POTRA domain-containing protein [Treponema sp.]|nr:FtsQ-type POTRA domain-containing protein [Treponema sp.]